MGTMGGGAGTLAAPCMSVARGGAVLGWPLGRPANRVRQRKPYIQIGQTIDASITNIRAYWRSIERSVTMCRKIGSIDT